MLTGRVGATCDDKMQAQRKHDDTVNTMLRENNDPPGSLNLAAFRLYKRPWATPLQRKLERPETGSLIRPNRGFLPPFCEFFDGCTSASFEAGEHEAAPAKACKGLFLKQAKQPRKVRDSIINLGPTGRHRAFQLRSHSQWPHK